MSPKLEKLLALLIRARRHPLRRKEAIAEYQEAAWQGLDATLTKDVSELLKSLAHDLDYFEPDPGSRREDPTYYGHERLERELDDAFGRLEALGIDLAGILPS